MGYLRKNANFILVFIQNTFLLEISHNNIYNYPLEITQYPYNQINLETSAKIKENNKIAHFAHVWPKMGHCSLVHRLGNIFNDLARLYDNYD